MRRAPIFLLLAFAASARATDTITYPFYGVEEIHRTLTSPRPLNINILEIDLNAPDISFLLSPQSPNPPLVNGIPDETITQTTRQFVTQESAQFGVNASFFRLDNSSQPLFTNNNSLAVSDGNGYSPWDHTNDVAINIAANNVATLIKAPSARPTGFETNPTGIPLYNAVAGSTQIVSNSVTVGPAPDGTSFLDLNPRTAMGYTADNRLLLATVDGRQTGFSEGMYLNELGDLMLSFGATQALNLDGGGSTTMVIDYTTDTQGPKVVNSLSSERYVGTSLGGFARPLLTQPAPLPGNVKALDEFETGFGHFASSMTASGSNRGINPASTATLVQTSPQRGAWDEQINIVADQDSTPGFLLRYLSGQGTPLNNIQMSTTGFVGFLLRTTTPGLHASIGIDENLATTIANEEQGTYEDIIPDGQWHLYQWNLADASEWDSFAGGNGQIDGPITTVDCLFIKGDTNTNATVFFDTLAYNPNGSLVGMVPEPSAALLFGAVLLSLQARGMTRRVTRPNLNRSKALE